MSVITLCCLSFSLLLYFLPPGFTPHSRDRCHAVSHNYIPLVPSNIDDGFSLLSRHTLLGFSLLSWVLWETLQPVVSAVCAQHWAVPSCHWPLWVPVRLLWLFVQPRQVAFLVFLTFSCILTSCQIMSLLSFSFCHNKKKYNRWILWIVILKFFTNFPW